jgi:hypothetical protein
MRKAFGTLALVTALLCGQAAFAQSPSPDARAAARDLIVTMNVTDQFKALMPMIFEQFKPVIVQGRPEVERDYNAMVPKLMEAFGSRLPELIDQFADLYAKHFTADEIRQVETFYNQPVWRKMLQLTPQLAQESMRMGAAWGGKIDQEIRGRMIEELRKRGHKI